MLAASAGTAIATAGEDGQVKVWSRAGMLRSTIAQADEPAYCVCWGGGSSSGQLLLCSGSNVTIAALQGAGGVGANSRNSGGAQASWKAHDALVLKADWSAATNLIVTGGEDCKYKVSPTAQCTNSPCHIISAGFNSRKGKTSNCCGSMTSRTFSVCEVRIPALLAALCIHRI
jgi:WD40 repeat protein